MVSLPDEVRRVPRRIMRQVPEDVLLADLETYRRRALELGAVEAVIIAARDVIIDERARLKCAYPPCPAYGQSIHCPPHTPRAGEMRQALGKYEHAILTKCEVPLDDAADSAEMSRVYVAHHALTGKIASTIEAQAYNDGYYFALGLGAGSCKTNYCRGLVCQALDSGRCRFPLKARPSMEAVGIDVFDLATKAGWDAYGLSHDSTDVSSIPCGISVGIVFVR